jgi:hypothetical protein
MHYKIVRWCLTACEVLFFSLAVIAVLNGLTFSGVMMFFLVFYCMIEKRFNSLAEQVSDMRGELHRLYRVIVSFNERKDK